MNKWFISDTHFSHANIIRYCGRPFKTVDEMNKQLIENWNELVKPNDTVFFLGDFGLGTTDFLASLCSQLNGNKVGIRGNHDGSPVKMHKIGFDIVLESAFIKIGRHYVELIHAPSLQISVHFQLHGHIHDKRPNKLVNRQLNLSVEVWNYKPVAEKNIIALLDKADKDVGAIGRIQNL
jgi:calcineurin-like phosphoesterase family protein